MGTLPTQFRSPTFLPNDLDLISAENVSDLSILWVLGTRNIWHPYNHYRAHFSREKFNYGRAARNPLQFRASCETF